MNVSFACPSCDFPARTDTSKSAAWPCPQCDHQLTLVGKDESVPSCCHVCGNGELYKKKDFPHSLGMAILVLACVASTISYGLYEKWLTWTILLGSAVIDGLLYLWVKDVVVCYRCQAHHRGIATRAPVPHFDLAIGERYRQEEIRLSEVKKSRSQEVRKS